MATRGRLVWLCALLAAQGGCPVVAQQLDATSCSTLGFFSEALSCSSCDYLAEFSLGELHAECNQCCQREKEEEAPAVVQAFVRGDKVNQFPNLEIKYERGADPEIRLLDENKQIVETLGIDNWNTDSVEEFFREHLSS